MKHLIFAILCVFAINAKSQTTPFINGLYDEGATIKATYSNGSYQYYNKPNVGRIVPTGTTGLYFEMNVAGGGSFDNTVRVSISQLIAPSVTTAKQLADTLDAWLYNYNTINTYYISQLAACCDTSGGGSGGGSSGGLNLIQFSDGSGGFYGINDTIVNGGDTTLAYYGIGEGAGSLKIGVNNTSQGALSYSLGSGNQSNATFSLTQGFFNTANGGSSLAVGRFNTANAEYAFYCGSNSVISSNDPENPLPTDTVFVVGNGSDYNNRSNALTLQRNGNLITTGAIANTAYYVDDTPGGFAIPDNKYLAIYDPDSLQAAATITMPANPVDGQIQIIAFGGTITSGTAVTALTIATTGGQTLNVGTAASAGLIEQPLTFLYIAYLNKWYLISK